MLPESKVQRESVGRLRIPEPSPTNEPFIVPSTCNLYPLAVVPIPTPVESTQNNEVPEPTLRVQSPDDVVAIPTLSKVTEFVSVLTLILPNGYQSFSKV